MSNNDNFTDKLKKLFNTAKDNLETSFLETNIKNKFNENLKTIKIYSKNEILPTILKAEVYDHYVVVFGDININPKSMIYIEEENKVYHFIYKSIDTRTIELENNSHTRSVSKLFLDSNVEEVEVIKVGDKYYRI